MLLARRSRDLPIDLALALSRGQIREKHFRWIVIFLFA
jgi:hypothetical protein